MSNPTNHVGEINTNKFGTRMMIVEQLENPFVLVEFQDAHREVKKTAYVNFKRGNIKNPYDRSVYGVGYIGEGEYLTHNKKVATTAYWIWASMIKRCYAPQCEKTFPTYYDKCTVCDEWHNFQTFAEWYYSHYYDVDGRLHLDKDILFPGNELYAPDRCLLVPQHLNMLFTKKNRKRVREEYADHIMSVADEYKGIVPEEVYNAVANRANNKDVMEE